MKALSLSMVSMLVLAACSESLPFSPEADVPGDSGLLTTQQNGAAQITVMSRNLYVGADVDQVIGALISPDPTDDIPALLGAINTFTETDFTARAAAFADEIALARPEVIGLQEVSTIDIDLSGLGIPVAIKQDFLSILLGALAARGLDYALAGAVTSIQASPLPGIDLTDRDVLLVDKSRVTVTGTPVGQIYSTNLGVVAPGVSLVRGYVIANLVVGGRTVTVATTHLESGAAPGLDLLRAAQATELVALLSGSNPSIVVGDLNDQPGSLMTQVLAGAGFVDVWADSHPNAAGFTCCHASNLANDEAAFDHRIDYVFARGSGPNGSLQGNISVIGDKRQDRVAGPVHLLWPSDHGGLVAKLVMAPAQALAAGR